MKTPALPVAVLILCIFPSGLLAQGSLTPPGAPAPMMKTLQQIEPRFPIFAIPTNISVPGSWYLTTNLTGTIGNGITIAADNVTLDLNGFALVGPGNSAIAAAPSRFNLCVRNGTIRGWTGNGVDSSARNTVFEDLRLFSNGGNGLEAHENSVIRNCTAVSNLFGIVAGEGASVSDCVAQHNTRIGISASLGSTLRGCAALQNDIGISASRVTIVDCSAYGNSSNGIVTSVSTISRCTAVQNGAAGIVAGDVSSVSECVIQGNAVEGLRANSACTIRDCTLANNGAVANTNLAAINLISYGNRVEGNTVVFNFNIRGIKAGDPRNYIIRNVANNNSQNYDLPAGTMAGVIVTTPGALNSATNCNANLSF